MLKTTLRPGFWCECWTHNIGDEQPPALMDSYDAYTEVAANEWVSTILRTISPALDTDTMQDWTPLHDYRTETRRALLRREPWTVSITHDRTRITWTVRPVLYLPLAHRQRR